MQVGIAGGALVKEVSRAPVGGLQGYCSGQLPTSCFVGIQIAQSRHDLHTLGPKVGIVYILGSLGVDVCLRCMTL